MEVDDNNKMGAEDPKKEENSREHHPLRDGFKKIYQYLIDLAKLNDDTDIESTINSIKKAVEFRGVNLWILAFAVIVASVGLNVNSTAVIIGAMLISPLMGPINGIGLAIGISDSELLRKSLKNLLIMVVISLLASSSYFLLTPLSDAQSELLARTTPTIFDVLIAFFGGFAGIVAISRKDQPFTVISGVAIATALMPPLCTAGYGIGTGQMNFFFGAFYLFFINSFFIALATFIMVRYLHFPQKKYLDPTRRKFVKRTIYLFSIIVLVPSIFMAYSVVKKASFDNQAIKYIQEIQTTPIFEDLQLVNSNKEYHKKQPSISLSIIGRQLKDHEIAYLKNELKKYGLGTTQLIIKQTGIASAGNMESELLENILDKKEHQIVTKDSVIAALKDEIKILHNDLDMYNRISQEISVQYPQIKSFSIAKTIYYDVKTQEKKEIPTIYIVWYEESGIEIQNKLKSWLLVRLDIKELKMVTEKE